MKKLNIMRFTASFLITGMLMTITNPIYATENKNEITIDIDGKFITFDQPPIIENGRTLVPMRAIFEALGATIEWIPKEQSIEAIKQTDTSRLKCYISLPENLMYVNYAEFDGFLEGTQTPKNQRTMFFYSNFDVPPKIINGRTLVPARAVAEAFGATVTWDGANQAVHISIVNARVVNPVTGESLSPATVEVTPQPRPTEMPRLTEPPQIGVTLGNIVKDPNNYDPNKSLTFTENYMYGSLGECTWYARARFKEVNSILIPYIGSAKEWLDNAKNIDTISVITDVLDIQDQSIAVKTPSPDYDQSHPGHVLFIEYVERDTSGKPINVYFTESNGANTLNKGKFDYGYDGVVQVKTFEEFIKPEQLELKGYIAPKK